MPLQSIAWGFNPNDQLRIRQFAALNQTASILPSRPDFLPVINCPVVLTRSERQPMQCVPHENFFDLQTIGHTDTKRYQGTLPLLRRPRLAVS
jgi:hypothetical protein